MRWAFVDLDGVAANSTARMVDSAAYEVEFITLKGQTVAVATVLANQLRPVGQRDITHVRELAAR